MRPVLVFDVEATGFNTGTNEVIQFSGFLYDLDEDKILFFFDYYCWTNVPIDPGAQAIHGIDKATLARLSGRKTLEYYVYGKLKGILHRPDLTFVTFNTDYDLAMINTTLVNHGYDDLNFGRALYIGDEDKIGRVKSYMCMMKYMNKMEGVPSSGKLIEYATYMGLKLRNLRADFEKALPDYKGRAHSALFDSYMLLELFKAVMKDGRSSKA